MNLKPGGGVSRKETMKKRRLASNLQILHPGENTDLQMYRFVVEIVSIGLLVVFVGALIGVFDFIWAKSDRILINNREVQREEYGGLDIEADLIAGIEVRDGEIYEPEIKVVVPARKYSKEEADKLFDEMVPILDEVILGRNDEVDHIIYPLKLVKDVDGYPFSINWESHDYEHIDSDGQVHNEELNEPILVDLVGDCSYEKNHWLIYRTVQLCPQELTIHEQVYKEIASALEGEKSASETKAMYTLPSEISLGQLNWTEKLSDNGLLIFGLILIICLAIYPLRETDVATSLKKRNRELLIEYPGFIAKLTLYMSAGMSVRNCFLRMGREQARRGEHCSYLGRELMITAHELETGIPEVEAYEHFGKRCGNREYMRFITLLVQNLKKGSTDLLGLLQKESEEAFILRKNEARKMGEEASTKLLLPMVMMLAIVMVIIMVPAYMSFS